MLVKRIVARTVLAAVVVFPMGAFASTVDLNFSSLSQAGNSFSSAEGASVAQQGFTIAGSDLFTWEASSPSLPSLNTADTSLFEFFAGAQDTLTDTGNAAFTLNSIDLAPLIVGGAGTFTVQFIGTFADSSTVSQTFTVNNAPDALQTFDFSGFTNVVSVSFDQGTNSGFFASQLTGYQFDNLNITTGGSSSPATTPEPNSMLLLGTGLMGLTGLAHRKKGLLA